MLKKMNLLSQKYLNGKISATLTQDYVWKFRDDLDINSLLQYLIFGQFIGKKKNKHGGNLYSGISMINRTKTSVMIDIRTKEKKIQFDTSAYDNCMHTLKQYN